MTGCVDNATNGTTGKENQKQITMEETVAIKTETRTETVVLDAQGEEIARLEGIHNIRPKDYEERLPVEVRVIETTVRLLNVVKIEKS